MLPASRQEHSVGSFCRQAHDLGAVSSVEDHGVPAAVALDGITAFTWVPLEHVVAGTEYGTVVAAATVHEVIARSGVDPLGAPAALDAVTARTGEDDCVVVASEDDVVAAARIDCQGLVPEACADSEFVTAAAESNIDRVKRGPIEAELGRAVVAEVDVQSVGITGGELQCDHVAVTRPGDSEGAVRNRRRRRSGVCAAVGARPKLMAAAATTPRGRARRKV